MEDFIGLEKNIADCLKVDGVTDLGSAPKQQPPASDESRLVGVLSQGVRAYIYDVTPPEQYAQSYGDYACGMALGFYLLRVPTKKLADVRDIFKENKKCVVTLPRPIQFIQVGGNEPVAEIATAHRKVMDALSDSLTAEGRAAIEKAYAVEAGYGAELPYWKNIINTYHSGLQGKNREFAPEKIKDFLELGGASSKTMGKIIKDFGLYKKRLNELMAA